MPVDADKKLIYVKLLEEIQKFDDPNQEQKLTLITKRLEMKKQNLNYYLRKYQDLGLIIKTQSQPFAIYQLTAKGRRVKENLIQSEKGVKTVIWKYHNLIVAYKVFTWGSWRFNPKKMCRMNNWSYQRAEAENGLNARVQDTETLVIFGPKMYGPDGEEMRIRASAMAQDAARWFVDHYDMTLGEPKVVRKGQKQLLGSEQLAKLIGRVKTDEIFVDASGGDENLEEYEDSFAIENILKSIETTPMRLDSVEKEVQGLAEMMRGFIPQSVASANAVNYSAAAIKNLQENADRQTAILERLASAKVSEPSSQGERRSDELSEPQMMESEHRTGLGAHLVPRTLEIEVLDSTPRFQFKDRGAKVIIGPFFQGARIYLPGDIARQLVRDGHARILEDTARE